MPSFSTARYASSLGGLLMCAGTLFSSASIFAEQFEVKGELHSKVFLKDPVLMYEVNQNFTVSVVDCFWQIKTVETKRLRLGLAIPLAGDYSLASTDGTNVFCLMSTESLKKLHPQSPHSGYAQVIWGTTPGGFDPFLTSLWYLFASSCHLSMVTNDFIPGLGSFVGESYFGKDLRAKAHWTLSSTFPLLPKRIDFLDVYMFQNPKGIRASTFTNNILQVLQTTNAFGLTVPLLARVDCYSPIQMSGTNSSALQISTEYRTVSVSSGEFISTLPPYLPENTYISDQRFNATGPARAVHYLSKGGSWQRPPGVPPINK